MFFCCCSALKSCLTLCKPMDCSTPSFPVLHYLPKFAQTLDHRVNDDTTILSSVTPFSFCPQSFPASGHFPMSQLFTSRAWYWSFRLSISSSNEYSGLISFKIDLFDCCPWGCQESLAPNFNSLALNLLYGRSLKSVHDYWKNHASFVAQMVKILHAMQEAQV